MGIVPLKSRPPSKKVQENVIALALFGVMTYARGARVCAIAVCPIVMCPTQSAVQTKKWRIFTILAQFPCLVRWRTDLRAESKFIRLGVIPDHPQLRFYNHKLRISNCQALSAMSPNFTERITPKIRRQISHRFGLLVPI